VLKQICPRPQGPLLIASHFSLCCFVRLRSCLVFSCSLTPPDTSVPSSVETSVTDASDFLPHRPSGHFWLSASLPLGGPDSPARCLQDCAPGAVCCQIKSLSICLLSSRVSAQVGVALDPFSSAPKRAGAAERRLSSSSPISCCE
jgi:hypothetical protein